MNRKMELSSFTTILGRVACHIKPREENHAWAAPSLTAAAPAEAGQRPAEVATDSGKGRPIFEGGRTAPHFSTVQKERSHLHKAGERAPKMEKLPFPPSPCSYVLTLENKLLSLLSKNSALPSSEACFLATESVVTAGRSGAVPVLHIQDVLLGAQGWRARALRPAAVLDPLQDAVDVLQPALLGANPTGHSAHPAR